MARIQARCTQCGSREFKDDMTEYTVPARQLKYGVNRSHGTETLECPTCDEETLHNRCGMSVPSSGR